MRRILSLLPAVAVLSGLAALSGCSNNDNSTPAPQTAASGPVKRMRHADAQTLADRYRTDAATTLGIPPAGTPTSSLGPCEGPHTFTAITYGDVPVPADQQPAALQKLRAHYTAERYTVAPAPTDGSTALNATTPDRVMISVAPEGTDILRVNVATPCFESDEPL
ncbi:hypothetical protein [Dactylosporangium matsuzakiense]|uniref:Lipoprotein n=1 Tax=Dactylosporangium matsuzakiense TaxID=53360 RepID=A0A9W6KJR0_9ACTN|nr:hypothetical protein [Dactylosporangium matsuzakiense]UWZ44064.1 hypothetical protein Dmats_42815 [Dactylosporangium matsuzakiense]GLL00759.1 hypothetical protein GCM10017581_025000 [Dactylosporangium matsuzakiense]